MSVAPLPVAVPLLMAAVLAALEQLRSRHRVLDALSLATSAAVALLDLVLLTGSLKGQSVYWFGGWHVMRGFPAGIAFVPDAAGTLLALCSALLTFAALLFSWHHFRAVRTYYHTLMLLFLASLQGFCLTGDLFNMFVFFELMGVAAYALTGYKIEEGGPLEGGLNFAVMNSVGGIMVLLGTALLYARTGGLNLAWIGSALAGKPAGASIAVAFILLAAGFLVKGAVVPFHFWLPDAHAVAPTPASILFSGIMVQLGLYAVVRIYWVVFSDVIAPAPLQSLLLVLAVATALTGAAMACLQRHLKRLLAYSTICHSGIMLAGAAMLDRHALAGTLLYVAGHGFVKGALFVGTGILVYHYRSVDEKRLHGRALRLRRAAILFLLGGAALAGLPPFGTWIGKGMIEEGAKASGLPWLSPLFFVASAATAGAVLRAAAGIFLGVGHIDPLSGSAPVSGEETPESEKPQGPTPAVMLAPMALLLLAALGTGALPQAQEVAVRAAAGLVDRDGYRALVLQGRPQPTSVAASGRPGWQAAVATTAGALAVAALFLAPGPLHGPSTNRVKAVLRGPISLLRMVHSGYIGDYIVWFVFGTGIAAMVAIALF